MKFGPFSNARAEEVRDLLENNGLKLEDFLEKPVPAISTRYLIIPSGGLLLALIAIVFARSPAGKVLAISTLFAFGTGTWLTVSTQLRFKNGVATFAVAIGAILMMMLATGTISLGDTAEFVKGLRKSE